MNCLDEPPIHIGCPPGLIGGYVLLPGDPGRVPFLAEGLDNAKQISSRREYLAYTGTLLGQKVSVVSTGIGGPSTAIAIEELSTIGAHTFLRVGTSGPIASKVREGDLVIATGAVRDEYTSKQYLPEEFPAVADRKIVKALDYAAKSAGVTAHRGIVHTKDSFYGEVETQRMPLNTHLLERLETWRAGGVLASDMETSALYVVASTLGKRAGALLHCGSSENSLEGLRRTALLAISGVIQEDLSSGTACEAEAYYV